MRVPIGRWMFPRYTGGYQQPVDPEDPHRYIVALLWSYG